MKDCCCAGTSVSSYIWDISNPNEPELELQPQSQMTVLNYNLKDTNLLGAGLYNGQFTFFDVRKGSAQVDSTAIEHSHRCADQHLKSLRGAGQHCSHYHK